MWRVAPILLVLALAAALTGCGATDAAAPSSPPPSTTSADPLNAAACTQYDKALADLARILMDPYQVVVDIETRDGERDVRRAAEMASGSTREAMSRTAAAVAALGQAANDTFMKPGGMQIEQEKTGLRATIDAVRPLCSAAGTVLTITIP